MKKKYIHLKLTPEESSVEYKAPLPDNWDEMEETEKFEYFEENMKYILTADQKYYQLIMLNR